MSWCPMNTSSTLWMLPGLVQGRFSHTRTKRLLSIGMENRTTSVLNVCSRLLLLVTFSTRITRSLCPLPLLLSNSLTIIPVFLTPSALLAAYPDLPIFTMPWFFYIVVCNTVTVSRSLCSYCVLFGVFFFVLPYHSNIGHYLRQRHVDPTFVFSPFSTCIFFSLSRGSSLSPTMPPLLCSNTSSSVPR